MSARDSHRAILRQRGVARFASPVPWAQAGAVNTYVLLGPPHTVIDPGYVASWGELVPRMAAAGVRVDDVGAVVLTHGHPDHAAAVEPLLGAVQAPVFLHPDDHDKLDPGYTRGKAAQYARLRPWFLGEGVPEEVLGRFVSRFEAVDRHRFAAAPPLAPLADGQVLELATGPLRVVATPGHTPGHVVLVDERRSVVLSGDHLLARVSPNAVLDFDDDDRRHRGFLRYLASLDAVASIDADLWCPGHGPCFDDLDGVLARLGAFYGARQRRLLELLDDAPATAYELSRRLFPGTDGLDRFLAFSEVIGHVDALQARGALAEDAVAGERVLSRA